MVKNMQSTKVGVESDSLNLVVVNRVKKQSHTYVLHLSSLLQKVVNLIQLLDWRIMLYHIRREANRCADTGSQ